MSKPLALVTGGAGFIGSHVVDRLLAEGWRVRVLDNLATGRRDNLAPALPRIEFIEGDLLDERCLQRAVTGVEVVFHLAALGSVTRSMQNPVATNEANVTGTLRLLEAARALAVRRVVYSSSSSVYGENPELPRVETQKAQPVSPYAVSKLAAEHYCRVFTRQFQLETVILRYFNVFGPRQDAHSAYAAIIPRLLDSARNGCEPVIFGDGTQTRDFTYVANVVDANLLAVHATGVAGEVFNVGSGREVSLLELIGYINECAGVALRPRFAPRRPGDVQSSRACIDKAQSLLDYEVKVTCFQGLASMLNGCRP